MKSVYRITNPAEGSEDIIAETKLGAVWMYCWRHGCPRKFVEEHCTVKRLGVA